MSPSTRSPILGRISSSRRLPQTTARSSVALTFVSHLRLQVPWGLSLVPLFVASSQSHLAQSPCCMFSRCLFGRKRGGCNCSLQERPLACPGRSHRSFPSVSLLAAGWRRSDSLDPFPGRAIVSRAVSGHLKRQSSLICRIRVLETHSVIHSNRSIIRSAYRLCHYPTRALSEQDHLLDIEQV